MDLNEFTKSGSLVSIDADKVLVGWGKRIWSKNNSEPSFYFPHFFLYHDSSGCANLDSAKQSQIGALHFERRSPAPGGQREEDRFGEVAASPNLHNPSDRGINHKCWFSHEHWELLTLRDLQKLISPSNQEKGDLKWHNPYYPFFCKMFSDLKSHFIKKKLQKGVPFSFEISPQQMTPQKLIQSLFNLLQYAQKAKVFLYGFWDHSEGILGGTPELLFNLTQDGSYLETMACAGTANAQQGKDLLRPKEQNEHLLVVEGIKESLKPFGSVTIGKTEMRVLPTLSHLITPISVELKNKAKFDELVKALHPTPALGAFPKEVGTKWLEGYQTQLDRKRYGAPVGCLFNGVGKCYVAIRNVQWDKSGMQIGAGCGVVAESELDKEWQEVQLKFRAIKEMLGL